jgi:3'-phosphoadenosine 5'-phosphosulfate synthase
MMYGGPTEVQWHAKSRREAGANFFVVGRDPAGVTGSAAWQKKTGEEDLYDGNHGRFVLAVSPSMNDLGLMSFGKVYYDQVDHKMRAKDKARKKDFLSISGTKMRKMAALGREFCTTPRVPDDWGKTVSCVPQGFMPVEAWKVVVNYYKNKDDKTKTWKPYSRMLWPLLAAPPAVTAGVQAEGHYGTKSFALYHLKSDGSKGSWWHDVPLKPEGAANGVYNFVVEITQGTVAKIETTKEVEHNPMMQDTKNGAVRFYEYGVTFFNYGLFPQTWDSPNVKDSVSGTIGDNDPLDVIELGGPAEGRPMGTIVPTKVVGSLRMLDGGETDDKIIVVDAAGPLASCNSIADLQAKLPGQMERLVDWLTNYKAVHSVKKVNAFASKDPTSMVEAVKAVEGSHVHWQKLVEEGSTVKHDEAFKLK